MKLFTTLLLLVPTLVASAAGVKISDLALSTAPSTNTFLEIADLNATGTNKSAKVLYTNLFMRAGLWTNAAGVVSLNNLTANGTLKLSADDGAGQGVIDLWTAGTKRWTLSGGGILYPLSNYDLGTTVNPVQAGYFSSLGVQLADRKITSGTGSPEGIRTAEVSSLYLQTDGAADTTLWTKTTGSGNTGWSSIATGSSLFETADYTNTVDGYPYVFNGIQPKNFGYGLAVGTNGPLASFGYNYAGWSNAFNVSSRGAIVLNSTYDPGFDVFGIGSFVQMYLNLTNSPTTGAYPFNIIMDGTETANLDNNGFYVGNYTPSSGAVGALYWRQGTWAIVGDADSRGANDGQGISVMGVAEGNYNVSYGVVGMGLNNSARYSIAVAGTIKNSSSSATNSAAYFEVNNSSNPSDVVWTRTSVLTLDSRDSGAPLITGRTNNGTMTFSVDSSGLTSSNAGFSSTAAETPVAISATGWTNSFGKAATAWLQGTAVTYVVYNNAGTAVRTNVLAAGTTVPIPLQSGGKFIITAGSGIDGSAVPW